MCIVTETGSGSGVHIYYPLSAIMKQQGTKKPDTLEVILPIQNEVDENYEISYIQDVVNTEYLSAVYPMQLSCLDEGGYNQDPTDPADSRFVKVDIDKFKGHYALQFTADSQGVEVPSAKTNKIDISGQFDINIWFTPEATQLQDGSDEPTLWSFRSSTVGLDIGIAGTNGNNSSWRVFLRVDNGSVTNAYTGSSELIMNTLSNPTRIMPCHIRVKRGSDNLLKAFVNGVEDISQSVTQNLQPSSTAMVFGDTETSTSDEYKGKIHEIKVYCGATLSDVDATRIRVTKPIVQYMKFNGKIVKITDKLAAKRVISESNSYNLTKAKLGTTYGGTIVSSALSSVAFKTIVQSAIDNGIDMTNGTFNVRNVDAFTQQQEVYALAGNIWQIGSLVEFINILLLYSNCIMYFTPRKNVIIETNAGHNTGYTSSDYFVFDQNSTTTPYNITTSEIDDSKVINKIILVGKGNVTDERDFTPTDGVRRTLRRIVKQLDNTNDLNELGYKILMDLGGLGGSSSPIHNLRFNHKVTVKRKNGNNSNVTGVTDKDLDEQFLVTQVKWNYPSGTTTINVGEYDIDFYEDIVKIGKSTDNLTDTTL